MQYAEILGKITTELNVKTGVRMVVAAPYSAEIMASLNTIYQDGYVSEILLVGDPTRIKENTSNFTVIAEVDEALIAQKTVVAARQVHSVIVKGNLSSGMLLKAVLSGAIDKLIANHVYIIQSKAFPNKTVFVADAGVNISPDLRSKTDIINNVLGVTSALGIDSPRVAIVCAVEKVNPAIPSTLDAQALREMGQRGEFAAAHVDGPMAFDVAMNPSAALSKGLSGDVAGQADVLIFDNIEASNSTAKALIGIDGNAMGVVVWGNTAIAFPSRGDSEQTRYHSLLLAAYLSAHTE